MRFPWFFRSQEISEEELWNQYPESRLKDIILFLTDRCNMRCAHCMFWRRIDSPGKEMALQEIQQIARTTPPLRTVAMTGGEPFLRKDIHSIVEVFLCENQTQHVQVNTNGLVMDKMERLVEKDLAAQTQRFLTYQVSLDGLEETHDRLRQLPGSFKKITKNLRRLVEMTKHHPYFRVVVLTNVNKENYHEIEPLARLLWEDIGVQHTYDLVRGAGFSAWNVPQEIFEWEDPRDCALPPLEKLESIMETIREINAREGGAFDQCMRQLEIQVGMYLKKPMAYRCLSAGRTIGVIYSDGSVAACEFTKPFAHLGEFDFDMNRLWESEEAERRRKQITGCHCTHTCFVLTSLQEFEERKASSVHA